MVAQAQVKQVTQFVFPPGKTVVGLRVDAGTVFTAGSIPEHVTELCMQSSMPVFEEGAIPPTLKYLNIKDLTKGSIYPSTLSLFVRDYTGSEPIPTGPKVFININEADKVSKASEHYLFVYGCELAARHLQSPDFDHGLPISERIFDGKIGYAKRTPKVKVCEPASVSAPALASPITYHLSLIKAKQELVQAQIKLVQTKQELVEAQLARIRKV